MMTPTDAWMGFGVKALLPNEPTMLIVSATGTGPGSGDGPGAGSGVGTGAGSGDGTGPGSGAGGSSCDENSVRLEFGAVSDDGDTGDRPSPQLHIAAAQANANIRLNCTFTRMNRLFS
jgi:hypothetical protein